MPARTQRSVIPIAPGVHLLRAENDDRAVVLLVVREDGRLEVWMQYGDVRIADGGAQRQKGGHG